MKTRLIAPLMCLVIGCGLGPSESTGANSTGLEYSSSGLHHVHVQLDGISLTKNAAPIKTGKHSFYFEFSGDDSAFNYSRNMKLELARFDRQLGYVVLQEIPIKATQRILPKRGTGFVVDTDLLVEHDSSNVPNYLSVFGAGDVLLFRTSLRIEN
jgi:hypothetical protein